MDRNIRIIDLTLGQLLDELDKHIGGRNLENRLDSYGEDDNKYIIGMKGLCQFLKCSYTTANKIMESGKLDHCSYKYGRKLYIERSKVMDALSK